MLASCINFCFRAKFVLIYKAFRYWAHGPDIIERARAQFQLQDDVRGHWAALSRLAKANEHVLAHVSRESSIVASRCVSKIYSRHFMDTPLRITQKNIFDMSLWRKRVLISETGRGNGNVTDFDDDIIRKHVCGRLLSETLLNPLGEFIGYPDAAVCIWPFRKKHTKTQVRYESMRTRALISE